VLANLVALAATVGSDSVGLSQGAVQVWLFNVTLRATCSVGLS
jgi:hypothetical protein